MVSINLNNAKAKNNINMVLVEKGNYDYWLSFQIKKGQWRGISWSTRSSRGKRLLGYRNIKANDSGENRNYLRIWDKGLNKYQMEVLKRDWSSKPFKWQVEISKEHLKLIRETAKSDDKEELKKLERKIKRLSKQGGENEKQEKVLDYNIIASRLGVETIKA